MRLPNALLTLVVFLLIAPGVLAQQTNSAWLTDNDRAKLESLRAAGFEALSRPAEVLQVAISYGDA